MTGHRTVNDGTVEVGFGDAAAPLVSGTEVNWPQELKEPKGKLGALLELTEPGGTIESFRTELNGLAEGLADAVNAIHTQGGGPAFFAYEAGKGAASLQVAVTATCIAVLLGTLAAMAVSRTIGFSRPTCPSPGLASLGRRGSRTGRYRPPGAMEKAGFLQPASAG